MIGDLFGGIGNWFSGLFNKDAAPAKGPTPAPLAMSSDMARAQAPAYTPTPAPVAAPAAPMMGPDQARAAMSQAPLAAPAPAPAPVTPTREKDYVPAVAGRGLGGALSARPSELGNAYLQRLINQKKRDKAAREAASPMWDEYNQLVAEGYEGGGFVDFAKNEAMNYALPSSSIYGRLGKAALSGALGMNKGGSVKQAGYENMRNSQIGPLGPKDILSLGKGRDVAKVKYKKSGGEVSDELEVSYHNPLAAAGKSDNSGG